jgi:hypothetical protein
MVACGERRSMGEQLLDGPVTMLFSDAEGSTDVRTERGDAVAQRTERTPFVGREAERAEWAKARPAEDLDRKVGAS